MSDQGDEKKKIYRWKVDGELYELIKVMEDGNLDLRQVHTPRDRPTRLLLAAPHEVDLVEETQGD